MGIVKKDLLIGHFRNIDQYVISREDDPSTEKTCQLKGVKRTNGNKADFSQSFSNIPVFQWMLSWPSCPGSVDSVIGSELISGH